MIRRSWRRAILRGIAALALIVAAGLGWNWHTANFATVVAGRVYRSGQMSAGALERALRAKGIKTVLNLRGAHAEEAWYRRERAAALHSGATQIDVAMSSCEWMSRAQMQAVLRVLETCDYPILIHCWRGAERTGLVSAFTELLRPGVSFEQAQAQLSIRYLFVPLGDGVLMPRHLDQYHDWLKRRGAAHSPALFRAWVAEGFHPGTPSREQWPYDPYPLVVVTHPAASDQGPRPPQTAQQGLEPITR